MLTGITRVSAIDVLRPFTVGDLYSPDTTSTQSAIAASAVGNVLISQGAGVLPAWGKVTLTSHVSGILPAVNGGTGIANTGTITNATDTTITGGGTLALAGFTLTVPATGTVGLLGTANTWTAINTFANTTDASSSTVGGTVVSGGLAVAKGAYIGTFANIGTTLTVGGLTSGRVPYASTGGLLIDSSTFTFNAAGGTGLNVANASSSFYVQVSGAAGFAKGFVFNTGGVSRWIFQADSNAESGADAGSPFTLYARTDAGAAIDTPINIVRAAGGAMTISRPTYFPATTTSNPSIRLPHGTAPSSPTDGDMWTTTAGLYIRINGSTVGPLS